MHASMCSCTEPTPDQRGQDAINAPSLLELNERFGHILWHKIGTFLNNVFETMRVPGTEESERPRAIALMKKETAENISMKV